MAPWVLASRSILAQEAGHLAWSESINRKEAVVVHFEYLVHTKSMFKENREVGVQQYCELIRLKLYEYELLADGK